MMIECEILVKTKTCRVPSYSIDIVTIIKCGIFGGKKLAECFLP